MLRSKITTQSGITVEVEASSVEELSKLVYGLTHSDKVSGDSRNDTNVMSIVKGRAQKKYRKLTTYSPWSSNDIQLVLGHVMEEKTNGKVGYGVTIRKTVESIRRDGDLKNRDISSIENKIWELRRLVLRGEKNKISNSSIKALREYELNKQRKPEYLVEPTLTRINVVEA